MLFGRITVRGRGRRTDGRTDGQIPPVFYRTSSPSEPLPKKWIMANGQIDSLMALAGFRVP